MFETPVGSKIETLQITNQIESRTREEENSCQENISVLATDSETNIIAFNDSTNSFNCQKCDYKTLYSGHLKQHTQNVHEQLKYDCTSCDRHSWSRKHYGKIVT